MSLKAKLLLLSGIIAIACTSQSTKSMLGHNPTISKGERLYSSLCASCHGAKVEAFADRREWVFGSDSTSIAKVIKMGAIQQGMPAFGDTLTDGEVGQLTEFILKAKDRVGTFQASKEQSANKDWELITDKIDSPWGIVQLPNSSLLITDKEGKLWIEDDGNFDEVSGVPNVYFANQAGLMDVILHPNFEENATLYLSYSKPSAEDSEKSTTAIFRCKLVNKSLQEGSDIFIAHPYHDRYYHYGSRMVFDKDGYLFFTVGERGNRDVFPQDLNNSNGKVHRIFDDGKIPEDNPFTNQQGSPSSIWSYGHRNPQGICYDAVNDRIYAHEHGPRGGDEINLIQKSLNYGWPVISYGINYSGTTFTKLTEKEGMEQPIRYWVPSIAPCGMTYVTSEKYPNWKGGILTGSLKYDYVALTYVNEKGNVEGDDIKLCEGIGRVRSVYQGRDGYLYVGTEKPGRVYRLNP